MEKICDLHCHSTFSDGTLTPAELVRLAEQKGLSALALTDHNTSHGLKDFMEAGKNSSVITVPGCEFTTEWNGKEIHVVGLFFREKYWPEITDFLELSQLAKINSNRMLVRNLAAAGYDISYEEVLELAGIEEFNRAHVARVLMKKGIVASVQEAFDTLLKKGNGFYVPAKRITSAAAIRFIKTFGATAIVAHPFLSLKEDEVRQFLPYAIEAGLDAMETHYTTYDEATTRTAEAMAEEFGLKQSGGSDFHGEAKPDIDLGSGRGNLVVPYSFYEDMRSCAQYD